MLRLRTALCGPLGALGDRLFWTGVVPTAMAAACLALTQGAGPAAVITLVALYNVLRLGFLIGLLVPKALGWLLAGAGVAPLGLAAGVALVGIVLSFRFAAQATSFRFGLVALVLSLFVAGR